MRHDSCSAATLINTSKRRGYQLQLARGYDITVAYSVRPMVVAKSSKRKLRGPVASVTHQSYRANALVVSVTKVLNIYLRYKHIEFSPVQTCIALGPCSTESSKIY